MIDKSDVSNLGGLNIIIELMKNYKNNDNIKMLDVGCGIGHSVNCLSDMGFDIIGIDSSEKIIEIGKGKYKNINLEVMDANNINFPGNYFDLILFECSLSVMKSPKTVLSKCKELLKEDGLILISDFFFKQEDAGLDTHTLDYWNKLFLGSGFDTVLFEDKSKEWKSYIGMVLWEYGELSGLLRGNENCNINENILKRETGYLLVILKKKD